MFALPPIPSWPGLHPLIIHFPIGLLFVAPLFVVLGAALKPEKSRPMFAAALVLMILGTASAIVAMECGEAAAELAPHNPQVTTILEQHEELAEQTVTTFAILTVAFLGIALAPRFLKKLSPRLLTTGLPLIFLLAYSWGILTLSNTAHHGGRLVHEFGVHAVVSHTGATEVAGR